MEHSDDLHRAASEDAQILSSEPIEVCSIESDDDLDKELSKLSRYVLYDENHRRSFLFHYYWIGDRALFRAVSHVWASLAEPRAARCTLVGLISGSGGTGKKRLMLTLQQFLSEALSVDNPIPPRASYDSLDQWHEAAMG